MPELPALTVNRSSLRPGLRLQTQHKCVTRFAAPWSCSMASALELPLTTLHTVFTEPTPQASKHGLVWSPSRFHQPFSGRGMARWWKPLPIPSVEWPSSDVLQKQILRLGFLCPQLAKCLRDWQLNSSCRTTSPWNPTWTALDLRTVFSAFVELA